jgi:nitroreductase
VATTQEEGEDWALGTLRRSGEGGETVFVAVESAVETSEGEGKERMELDVAIRKRRMFREFDGEPVAREQVHKLLWAAGRAQQGRPGVRHMIVVDDPVLLKTAKEVLPGFAFISNAPLVIVLCSDLSVSATDGPAGREHATRLDAGAACAHLGLMARQLDLGLCTVTSWSDAVVRELFSIPETLRPDVTVAIGHPVANPAMKAARGPQFLPDIHCNDFGTPYEEVKRYGRLA